MHKVIPNTIQYILVMKNSYIQNCNSSILKAELETGIRAILLLPLKKVSESPHFLSFPF